MNRYWNFLLKITLRNKFNFLPLLFLIIISLFLLIMNIKVNPQVNFEGTIKRQSLDMTELIEEYNNYDPEKISELDFKEITDEKNKLIHAVGQNNKALSLTKKGHWNDALKIQLKTINDYDMKILANKELNVPLEYKKSVLGVKAIYEYLYKNNLKPDVIGMETQGFPYMFRMIDILFPIIFIISLVTILTNIFTETFKQGIDIDRLFPMKKSKLLLSKLCFGIMIAISSYLIILFISFTAASLFNGTNSINYPINMSNSTFSDVKPLKYLMVEGLLIQLLCLVFSVLFVYIVSFMTKNKIATLFTSILVLCGATLSVNKLEPLESILHLLPFTYFNTISVLVGEVAVISNNNKISFVNGLIVLLFWIIIELFVALLINNKTTLLPKKKLDFSPNHHV